MGRYPRRAEFRLASSEKKKVEKLDERKGEKLGRIRIRSRLFLLRSLVSPSVNIECKYTPLAGYLGKMKRGEFERND